MLLKKLTISQIQKKLEEIPPWRIHDNDPFLIRTYQFKNWKEVMIFLKKISDIAEKLNHHPNINFTYGFCEVKIQTHDVGGITDLDFELAKNINLI